MGYQITGAKQDSMTWRADDQTSLSTFPTDKVNKDPIAVLSLITWAIFSEASANSLVSTYLEKFKTLFDYKDISTPSAGSNCRGV